MSAVVIGSCAPSDAAGLKPKAWRICPDRALPSVFPPEARAAATALACSVPKEQGKTLSRWSRPGPGASLPDRHESSGGTVTHAARSAPGGFSQRDPGRGTSGTSIPSGVGDEHTRVAHLSLQGAARRPTDPVWLYPNGKPMTADWLRNHVAAIGRAVGIESLYPHRLRHTCATRLLNAGMDITGLQKLWGHEQISTTMIDARVQDATVEADYRQALQRIERQQLPLSSQPIAVDNWQKRRTGQ